MNRKTVINAKISSIGNGAHIIVSKEYIGKSAKVIIIPSCLNCKYYKKRGEICKTDACVNKKVVYKEIGDKTIDYLAFASNLPELPKDCQHFVRKK